ncbi:MAG: hypothetical protein M3X11_03170 [Acidobacteriota bacterium]|nr:hypothetical protein [Acidobacteriota bacterium]
MTTPNELRGKFHGVIAFPITPFNKYLSLDLEGLRHNLAKLVEHPMVEVKPEEAEELRAMLKAWEPFLP